MSYVFAIKAKTIAVETKNINMKKYCKKKLTPPPDSDYKF